jgi:hypothetical protein
VVSEGEKNSAKDVTVWAIWIAPDRNLSNDIYGQYAGELNYEARIYRR